MNQTSEEKSLPPSERKLREARRKGQVAKSQDLVSGVVMLVSTLFLAFAGSRIADRVATLIDLGATLQADPFGEARQRLVGAAGQVVMDVTLPLLAVVVGAVVLTNIAAMKGLTVSAEPLAPRFEKINPVEGFKRIFSMRGIVEFLKAIVKVGALTTAFVLVFRYGLADLFRSADCGLHCLASGFRALMAPLAATAVVAFLAVGSVDVLLQRWLFRRDMRMTKTERKREQRDTDGDPAIRRQREKDRRAGQVASSRIGLANASVLVAGTVGPAIGVRYRRGETPVPVVACRASADQVPATIEEAARLGIPLIRDDRLAPILARNAIPGQPIPDRAFQPVADILVKFGII